VVDMRQAPTRNDPEFEDAMSKLRKEIFSHYARVAVLVSSEIGVLQVNRIGRNEGARTYATQSEDEAIRFAGRA
jgi:sulfite reductase (NADPH) flavoprotein alpha-component